MLTFGPDTINSPIALYVHIPFCETKCPYCDFNTYAGIEPLMGQYVDSLVAEIALWGNTLGSPQVRTVFFGGGTPSYLPQDSIGSVIAAINNNFEVQPGAEVTMEANPGDLTLQKLEALRGLGINRLSIGVQSFDDDLLQLLGRRHTSDQATIAFHVAAEAGFENVSIDLMYGLPHQDVETWQRTLDQACGLRPKHISMYCLTLEEGTPLHQWVKIGRFPDPDPDLAADMYEAAQHTMGALAYRHYEISNWAQPGYESLHNLVYGRNEPYLGVGPGAHSYLADHRFANLNSPREYIKKLTNLERAQSGRAPSSQEQFPPAPTVEYVERIDKKLAIAETLMMGLRLDTGIDVREFTSRFGVPPDQVHGETIVELTSLGLLESTNGSIRLTQRGRMLGNEVFSRFFE